MSNEQQEPEDDAKRGWVLAGRGAADPLGAALVKWDTAHKALTTAKIVEENAYKDIVKLGESYNGKGNNFTAIYQRPDKPVKGGYYFSSRGGGLDSLALAKAIEDSDIKMFRRLVHKERETVVNYTINRAALTAEASRNPALAALITAHTVAGTPVMNRYSPRIAKLEDIETAKRVMMADEEPTAIHA